MPVVLLKSAPDPPAVFALASLTSLFGGPPQLDVPPSMRMRPAITNALPQTLFMGSFSYEVQGCYARECVRGGGNDLPSPPRSRKAPASSRWTSQGRRTTGRAQCCAAIEIVSTGALSRNSAVVAIGWIALPTEGAETRVRR